MVSCGATAGYESTSGEPTFRKRQLPDPLPDAAKMAFESAGATTDTPGSPTPAGGAVAVHHVAVRLVGRFVDARYRVVVKVRLVDHAVDRGNLTTPKDAGPEHRGAPELRLIRRSDARLCGRSKDAC